MENNFATNVKNVNNVAATAWRKGQCYPQLLGHGRNRSCFHLPC